MIRCMESYYALYNIPMTMILCRAYANAIELQPESGLFWHDLAVGYLYLGQVYYYNLIGQTYHMTDSRAGKEER